MQKNQNLTQKRLHQSRTSKPMVKRLNLQMTLSLRLYLQVLNLKTAAVIWQLHLKLQMMMSPAVQNPLPPQTKNPPYNLAAVTKKQMIQKCVVPLALAVLAALVALPLVAVLLAVPLVQEALLVLEGALLLTMALARLQAEHAPSVRM